MSHDSPIVKFADKALVAGVSIAAGMKLGGGISWSWWLIFSPFLALWTLTAIMVSSIKLARRFLDDPECTK